MNRVKTTKNFRYEVIPPRHLSIKKFTRNNSELRRLKKSIINSLPHSKSRSNIQDLSNKNAFILRSFKDTIEKIKIPDVQDQKFKVQASDIKNEIKKTFNIQNENNKKKLHKIKLDFELSYTRKSIKGVIAEFRKNKVIK